MITVGDFFGFEPDTLVKYLLTSLTFPLVGKILTFKGEVEAAPSPTISADDLRCHCGGIGDIKPARVRALDRGVNLIIAKSSRTWKVWKGSGGVLYATPERWEGAGASGGGGRKSIGKSKGCEHGEERRDGGRRRRQAGWGGGYRQETAHGRGRGGPGRRPIWFAAVSSPSASVGLSG